MRHSSAQNVVERILGILKRCFRILQLPTEYSIKIQARIPTALCAVYNFIHRHEAPGGSDADELSDQDNNQHNKDNNQHNKDNNQHNKDGNQCNNNNNEMDDPAPAVDAVGAYNRSWQLHEDIAGVMWVDYQMLLAQQAGGNADNHISDGSSDI